MKKRKKKNGITLLALVITIVIMLLLAGVAIQMTMGENGLIAKSVQAQKEQAKAELYDTAKIEYVNLKTKALEEGDEEPDAEEVLSETNFLNKYDITEENITDKKGNKIDTVENLVKVLSEGKNIPQVAEQDKDKLVLQLNVKDKTSLWLYLDQGSHNIDIEYHDGTTETITNLGYHASRVNKEYNPGTYIIKFNGTSTEYIKGIGIELGGGDATFDVINWGKNPNTDMDISIQNVNKVYYPEPDLLNVTYSSAVFSKIPKKLFRKKKNSKIASRFSFCQNITKIPEDLFKNYKEGEDFSYIFEGCKNIREIPENLFKYNTKAKNFNGAFAAMKIESIPENLFKNNPLATDFNGTFEASEIKTIPENLFKYNNNVRDARRLFYQCSNIINIPEKIIEFANKVKERTGDSIYIYGIFTDCTSASNYSSLPSYMKQY